MDDAPSSVSLIYLPPFSDLPLSAVIIITKVGELNCGFNTLKFLKNLWPYVESFWLIRNYYTSALISNNNTSVIIENFQSDNGHRFFFNSNNTHIKTIVQLALCFQRLQFDSDTSEKIVAPEETTETTIPIARAAQAAASTSISWHLSLVSISKLT